VPIFYQQEIDADTKLGVWKIEEPEEFFTQHVMPQRNVSHPHKKLQHLAGRYLLKYLFKDFPTELIQIADTRKPFLEDEAFHFSISHCCNCAAVLVSRSKRVGVDVELIADKANRLRHKFSSHEEWAILGSHWLKTNCQSIPIHENTANNSTRAANQLQKLSTLIWSCKEAVFKWYSLGGVDFKNHIQIKSINSVEKNHLEIIASFAKQEEIILDLNARIFDDVCLSWVIT
jgi:phosphopantetheinyl transferase